MNSLQTRWALRLPVLVAALAAGGCVVAPGPERAGAYPPGAYPPYSPGYPVVVRGDRERYERDRDQERRAREYAREREHERRERDDDDDDRDERRRGGRMAGPQVDIRIGGYFGEEQRRNVQGYYRQQPPGAFCPPGLAKKNNGCMPPGQARQWNMGQPLPSDVAYAPLAPAVQVHLGPPPAGYRFVQVASDILMIAVGTAVVVDAIQDLGGY